jgi:hypothetical protein
MTTAVEGGEGSVSRPGRSLPPGKTRYPLYRRLGGPQGRFGQARKISPPPGFDPRTVQPVASRYTNRAIAAHVTNYIAPQIVCAVKQYTICIKFTFLVKLQVFYWLNLDDGIIMMGKYIVEET